MQERRIRIMNSSANRGNARAEKQPGRQQCLLTIRLFSYVLISCPFRNVTRMSSLVYMARWFTIPLNVSLENSVRVSGVLSNAMRKSPTPAFRDCVSCILPLSSLIPFLSRSYRVARLS